MKILNGSISKRCIVYIGLGLATQCFFSCKREKMRTENASTLSKQSSHVNALTPRKPTPWIAVDNGTDHTLEIYNCNVPWNNSTRSWVFKPTTALGYSAGSIAAVGASLSDTRLSKTYGFPGKAKVAFAAHGRYWVGVGAYVPLGSHVKGQKLWEVILPSTPDPSLHAVELMPNGNVALISNSIGWIRIYNTAGTNYAEAPLHAAHAVSFDAATNLLYVGGETGPSGQHGIFVFTIGTDRANPTIEEDVSKRAVLPFGKSGAQTNPASWLCYPHDISPDLDDNNKLIYGDHSGVYSYDKTTKTFSPTPGASHRYINGLTSLLKSAGKQSNGGRYHVTEAYNPAVNQFATDKVDFFNGTTGAFEFSRTVSEFRIYRAKVWEIDPPVNCDYGDAAKSQMSVFDNGLWKFIGKADVTFGQAGDIPVAADYNGDGVTDIAVFRPSTVGWIFNGAIPNTAHGSGTDVPVPADYDGNGKAVITVFRPSNNTWYFKRGTTVTSIAHASHGDIPVPADYTGDGKADVAVWRPSNGTWYVYNGATTIYGQSGDIPVPGDYRGLGFASLSVFRPSNKTWYVLGGINLVLTNYIAGDIPVPGDYTGDGKNDMTLYRPSTGQLYVNNILSGTVTGAGTSYKAVNLPYHIRRTFFP